MQPRCALRPHGDARLKPIRQAYRPPTAHFEAVQTPVKRGTLGPCPGRSCTTEFETRFAARRATLAR